MAQDEDIWTEIMRIHEADNAKPLNQIDGLWRRELRDGWTLVVNGQKISLTDPDTQFRLQPYHALAVRGGFPRLWFGPPGSSGVAIGEGSEDAFWDALKNTAVA
jgi:hypothetical protein